MTLNKSASNIPPNGRNRRGRRYHSSLEEFLTDKMSEAIETAIAHLEHDSVSKAMLRRLTFSIHIEKIVAQTALAGQANVNKKVIDLHHLLFEPGHEQDLLETFLHELGHHWSWFLERYSGHGKPWKEVMGMLGQPNELRCHDLPYLNAAKPKSRYRYVCQDCEHEFKRTRPLQAGRIYFHGPCKKKLNRGQLTDVSYELRL